MPAVELILQWSAGSQVGVYLARDDVVRRHVRCDEDTAVRRRHNAPLPRPIQPGVVQHLEVTGVVADENPSLSGGCEEVLVISRRAEVA